MIENNKMVSLRYELRDLPEGDAIEVATAENPMRFISGQEQTLEYFEINLRELSEGDKFDFKINVENAYGELNEDMIVELPRGIFAEVEDGDLAIGKSLPMVDSMGRHLMGNIIELGEENIKMDFNHPLAGKDLYFKGEVLEIRDATPEELAALHSSSCGGGCSGCSSHSEEGGCSCE